MDIASIAQDSTVELSVVEEIAKQIMPAEWKQEVANDIHQLRMRLQTNLVTVGAVSRTIQNWITEIPYEIAKILVLNITATISSASPLLKNIDIPTETTTAVSLGYTCDTVDGLLNDRIKTIAYTLLTNGLQYTPSGLVRREVEINIERELDTICITLTPKGIEQQQVIVNALTYEQYFSEQEETITEPINEELFDDIQLAIQWELEDLLKKGPIRFAQFKEWYTKLGDTEQEIGFHFAQLAAIQASDLFTEAIMNTKRIGYYKTLERIANEHYTNGTITAEMIFDNDGDIKAKYVEYDCSDSVEIGSPEEYPELDDVQRLVYERALEILTDDDWDEDDGEDEDEDGEDEDDDNWDEDDEDEDDEDESDTWKDDCGDDGEEEDERKRRKNT